MLLQDPNITQEHTYKSAGKIESCGFMLYVFISSIQFESNIIPKRKTRQHLFSVILYHLNEADESSRIQNLSCLVDFEGLSELTHVEHRQSICILHATI